MKCYFLLEILDKLFESDLKKLPFNYEITELNKKKFLEKIRLNHT